jgi:hypothetical protein
LNIKTTKSHGIYAIPLEEQGRLRQLYEKFGLVDAKPEREASRVDAGDVGDVSTDPGLGQSASNIARF